MRTIAIWVATIVTTPLLYSILVSLLILNIYGYSSHDFDKEKWFAEKEKRYELSKNIIESKMLMGKTKSEVKQLLGDAEEGSNDTWNYDLGFTPGHIDVDYLRIEFKDEKVIKVSQHQG